MSSKFLGVRGIKQLLFVSAAILCCVAHAAGKQVAISDAESCKKAGFTWGARSDGQSICIFPADYSDSPGDRLSIFVNTGGPDFYVYTSDPSASGSVSITINGDLVVDGIAQTTAVPTPGAPKAYLVIDGGFVYQDSIHLRGQTTVRSPIIVQGFMHNYGYIEFQANTPDGQIRIEGGALKNWNCEDPGPTNKKCKIRSYDESPTPTITVSDKGKNQGNLYNAGTLILGGTSPGIEMTGSGYFFNYGDGDLQIEQATLDTKGEGQGQYGVSLGGTSSFINIGNTKVENAAGVGILIGSNSTLTNTPFKTGGTIEIDIETGATFGINNSGKIINHSTINNENNFGIQNNGTFIGKSPSGKPCAGTPCP